MNTTDVTQYDFTKPAALVYFTRAMNPDCVLTAVVLRQPVYSSVRSVAERMLAAPDIPVDVTLEPGDRTRYNLRLSFVNPTRAPGAREAHGVFQSGALLVVRYPGDSRDDEDETSVALVVPRGRAVTVDSVRSLSRGNQWTEHVLAWWLSWLLHRVWTHNATEAPHEE